MNLETKITIYKFTPQLFTLTRNQNQVFHLECGTNKKKRKGDTVGHKKPL